MSAFHRVLFLFKILKIYFKLDIFFYWLSRFDLTDLIIVKLIDSDWILWNGSSQLLGWVKSQRDLHDGYIKYV